MNDMWKKVGYGKLPKSEEGKVAGEDKEVDEKEIMRQRNLYRKYNRKSGETEKVEIPSWDKQKFGR